MKKWLFGLCVVFILFAGGIYVLIPGNIVVSKVITVTCTPNAAYRFVSQESKVIRWWPNDGSNADVRSFPSSPSFIYKKDTFQIGRKFQHVVELIIRDEDSSISSTMNVLALPSDSAAISWQCNLVPGSNPIKRVSQYKRALRIGNSMADILNSLSLYLGKKENVYGLVIGMSSIEDSILLANKFFSPDYPSTSDIYHAINRLKEYITKKGANVTGRPMVNIGKLGNNGYQTMVAVPMDKVLQESNGFFNSRMVRGRFMITEVKGGINAVNNALEELQYYFGDYGKTTMAIPFQSLITDRSQEPDSTKWITKIYAPVF